MRLPNGFGSIYKLSGKRRRPYAAIVTTDWTDEGKPIRKYIGYYEKRQEALTALADYNQSPYSLDNNRITLTELWNKWVAYRSDRGKPIPRNYTSSYNHCKPLWKVPFCAITTIQLQQIVDSMKGARSAAILRSIFNMLYKYANVLDMGVENKMQSVDFPVVVKSTLHKPFTDLEIAELWSSKKDFIAQLALLLIYTGMRPTELIKMKNSDVHLEDRYMIGGIKTANGINRTIPIAKKIMPIITDFYDEQNEYLVTSSSTGNNYAVFEALRQRWNNCKIPAIKNHLPHDGRHTCETRLHNAGVDMYIIQRIIGHTTRNDVDSVYIHKTITQLIDAIDRI